MFSLILHVCSEESNFHIFYYLYDGLTYKNWHLDYHLNGELRQHHTYLTADKQDLATKKVSNKRKRYVKFIYVLKIIFMIVPAQYNKI